MNTMNWSNKVMSAMAKQKPAEQTTSWNQKVLSAMSSDASSPTSKQSSHRSPSASASASISMPSASFRNSHAARLPSSDRGSPSSSLSTGSPGSVAALRHRTRTAGAERLRRDISSSRGAGADKPTTMPSTESLPTMVLSEANDKDADDVAIVTPRPSSFATVEASIAKVEESIAAQQKLLRSMIVEGQKIMQQQQYQRQQQSFYRERMDAISSSLPTRLALPMSPTEATL